MSQGHLILSQRLQFCRSVQKGEGSEEKRRVHCVLKNDLLTAFFWTYFLQVGVEPDRLMPSASVRRSRRGRVYSGQPPESPCANSSGVMQYRARSVRCQGSGATFGGLGQIFQCPTHSSPNVTGAVIGRT